MSDTNLQQAAAAAQGRPAATNAPEATNVPVTGVAAATSQEDSGMDLGENSPVNTYDNNNTGALFSNKQRKLETHPNSQGKCQVGGVWYWVSGWTKVPAAGGDKFISLAFTPLKPEEVAKYC